MSSAVVMGMTEIAKIVDDAARALLDAGDKARAKGEQSEEYFRRLRAAYVEAIAAISIMRFDGKIDPPTFAEIESRLRAEFQL